MYNIKIKNVFLKNYFTTFIKKNKILLKITR